MRCEPPVEIGQAAAEAQAEGFRLAAGLLFGEPGDEFFVGGAGAVQQEVDPGERIAILFAPQVVEVDDCFQRFQGRRRSGAATASASWIRHRQGGTGEGG